MAKSGFGVQLWQERHGYTGEGQKQKQKKTKIFIVFQYLIIIFAENITNINNQQKPELLAQLL